METKKGNKYVGKYGYVQGKFELKLKKNNNKVLEYADYATTSEGMFLVKIDIKDDIGRPGVWQWLNAHQHFDVNENDLELVEG